MNNRIIPRGGLLSDRQIRKLCQTPSLKAIADSLNNDRDWRSHLYYQVGEPDSERAKMALAEAERRLAEWPAPMIEPFEPGQVRKFITFRPEIALGARCTYEFGYIGPIQPTCYGY